MSLAAFWSHQEGLLELHVGLCWLLLGSCWLKVASSWLQDGSRYVYVGSSWPQAAQEGPQRPPKYPKMRPKWLQDGFQIDMFWLHRDFFEILKKWLPLQPGPFFSGFAPSDIVDFGYILEQNSLYFGLCCPVCLKMPQGCLKFAPKISF